MNDFLKEAFTSEWLLKYLTELFATAFLVALGNGAVANVELTGTKGNKSGWIVIAFGYGFGVMMPALMFGDVSGNHINPAFTLGLAASGLFSWVGVPGYLIAQLLGAFLTMHKLRILTIFLGPSQLSQQLTIMMTLQKIVIVPVPMVLSTSLQDHSSSSLVPLP